jgi:hypothetical protein
MVNVHRPEYLRHLKKLRTALFCVFMQRVVVTACQHLGTTYHFHLQGSRIQKKACSPKHGVYIRKSVGSEKSQ